MMKKITCLCLCFISLFSLFSPVGAETVKIISGESPPTHSEQLENNGIIPYLIRQAYGLVGVEVEYSFKPWKRAYYESRTGLAHGSSAWVYTTERGKEFYYSDPVRKESRYFFHLKTLPFDWKAMEDLRKTQIVALLGYVYGSEFDSYAEQGKLNVQRVRYVRQALKMVKQKRADVFPEAWLRAYYILNKHFTPEETALFTFHPKPVVTGTTSLILGKKRSAKQKKSGTL